MPQLCEGCREAPQVVRIVGRWSIADWIEYWLCLSCAVDTVREWQNVTIEGQPLSELEVHDLVAEIPPDIC